MAIAYNSNYKETIPFSDAAAQVHCLVGVEQTVTVPGSDLKVYQALFEYASNSNVFVRLNGVPAIPAGGTVGTEQYNEFKPEKRYVHGGDVIHFITPDTFAFVGVSFMQLQG